MEGIMFVAFYFGLFYLTVTAKDQIMSHPNPLYDEFYDELDPDMLEQAWEDCDDCDGWDEFDDWDESMDGDHDSAMESAGWGTDEDYGYYGEDY